MWEFSLSPTSERYPCLRNTRTASLASSCDPSSQDKTSTDKTSVSSQSLPNGKVRALILRETVGSYYELGLKIVAQTVPFDNEWGLVRKLD